MTRAARTPSAATKAPSKRAKTPSKSHATILASAAEMRVRERHFPRLCQACQAPMAVQEDSCWACGAIWDSSRVAKHAEDQLPDRAVAA
jgi:predicted amidophosphoribosyltransferase